MTGVKLLTGDKVSWYEDGNCIICGFSHRYQWPSGSDASGHDGSYVACVNTLMPVIAQLRKALEEIAHHDEHRTDEECVHFCKDIARNALQGRYAEDLMDTPSNALHQQESHA